MFWFKWAWGLCFCGWHVVTILYLGSLGEGVLVSAEQHKDMHQIVMYILWKWTRILFYTHFLCFWIPALPSDQFSSVAQSCPSLWDPMDCSIPGFPVPHQLLEFTQTHVHWVGDANQPTHSLSYPSPPAFNLSQHQGLLSQFFTSGGQSIWSFSFSISPSNEYSGLISFAIDLFDLLAVQGILKSLLQHHHSKASILRCSDFFMVQLTSVYDYWKDYSFD